MAVIQAPILIYHELWTSIFQADYSGDKRAGALCRLIWLFLQIKDTESSVLATAPKWSVNGGDAESTILNAKNEAKNKITSPSNEAGDSIA